MYIWINGQKQHGVYERHHCRFIAAYPILGLKLPQNTMWTQLSMTLRILRDFYGKYQNTFQNIAFTVLLKPPLSQYTQANIQKLDSLTSLNILKIIMCLKVWADMNLKSFANCHKTGHRTHMACLASKQNTSWVFAPWFQVTVSNNLISMHHVHL